jgi:hypothetical protein
MERLTECEVNKAVGGFGEALGQSIMGAVRAHPAFFEIVARPSMLPVVATIWSKIQDFQNQGRDLTSAVLMEYYFQATYRRKEEQIVSVSDLGSYLLLPREVREVFSLAIVWNMACGDARNTIKRTSFNGVIEHIYDDVLKLFQKAGVPSQITKRVRGFEMQFRDEKKADMIERVSNEVASAGLFVPDPAGGPSNLGLPHKQFYEYMIAKASWLILVHKDSLTSQVLRSVGGINAFLPLLREQQSLMFFSELIGQDFTVFKNYVLLVRFVVYNVIAQVVSVAPKRLRRFKGIEHIKYSEIEHRLNWLPEGPYYEGLWGAILIGFGVFGGLYLNHVTVQFIVDFGFTEFETNSLLPNIGVGLIYLFSLFGLFFIVTVIRMALLTAPKAIVFTRIVGNRLISNSINLGTRGSPKRILYRECLLALLDPKKFKVVASPSDRGGRAQLDSEIRDMIAPVA